MSAPPRARDIWGVHDTQGPGTVIPSGCGFYRITLPFDELRSHGWKAEYSYTLPEYDPSVVVCQRWDRPEMVPVVQSLLDNGFRVVYEIDDDPFSVDQANWLAHTYRRDDVLGAIRDCAAMADLVTVSTGPLAKVFGDINSNVTVIPNFIPEQLLRYHRRRHSHKLTIGWTGGASHSRDLAMIAQVWRDVVDEMKVRGHIIGVDYRNLLRPKGFSYTEWEPDVRSYYSLIDFDIGLAPIAEHPFAESKSHIKALEYAALGIPCVASACEAYSDFVIDGLTGFLAETPAQWKAAMVQLIRDARLREEMGRQARRLAEQWTIERNWQRWNEAYCNLLERT